MGKKTKIQQNSHPFDKKKVMEKIEYYQRLPDVISADALKSELQVLLLDNIGVEDELILSAISELSSRYVDSCVSIPDDMCNKLNEKLISMWDRNSIENTELVIGAIINFELFDAYDYLKNESSSVRNVTVKKWLEDTFLELGDWGRV